MRVDYLNSLRALEAVLRKGGLRAAADELGVTPAAVGQQVRNLETNLGVRLMTRRATGAQPTEHAEQVSGALTRHMTGLGDVLERLKASKKINGISVSVLPSFAEIWFPRHLASLFSQIPDVDLRLESSRHTVDLFAGDFDFAVRHMGEPSSEYESRFLLPDICAPVSTPGFAERYVLNPNCTSLKSVPLAEIDLKPLASSARHLPDMFDWCRRYAIEAPDPSSGMVILKDAGGVRMASAGLAIYLSGLVEVIGELSSGDLVLPFGPEKTITGAYGFRLIWRRELRLSPVQRKFVDWIEARAAEDRAWIEGVLSG